MIWISLLLQVAVVLYAIRVVKVAEILDENDISNPLLWGFLWPIVFFVMWIRK